MRSWPAQTVTIAAAISIHLGRTAAFSSQQTLSGTQNNVCRDTERTVLSVSNERDMSRLSTWSETGGVKIHPAAKLTSSGGGNWGISLQQPYAKTGETIMSIPNELVLSSQRSLREFNLQGPTEILEREGQSEHRPEFVLMTKLLLEKSKGPQSEWHVWLSSLPTSFNTGVCMDDVERSYLPPMSLAQTEFMDEKYRVYTQALKAMEDKPSSLAALLETDLTKGQEAILWAFNVVYTRSWRVGGEDGSDADSNIVPLGDMFNHGEPANVAVIQDPELDPKNVNIVLQTDLDMQLDTSNVNLHLSYGLTNSHRFLTIFGFVDESMPVLFSQIVFKSPSPEMIALGCNDRSEMVFNAKDGAVANAVWDSVLYAILQKQPNDQRRFFEAHQAGDRDTKREIHGMYAADVCIILRNHVQQTLQRMPPLLDVNKSSVERNLLLNHSNLPLIMRHNAFLIGVFQKALKRLDWAVERELSQKYQGEQTA